MKSMQGFGHVINGMVPHTHKVASITICCFLKTVIALPSLPRALRKLHSPTMQATDQEAMEGAHMLCMADAPEAREEAVALWAWLRIEWALGLMQAWATTSTAEVSAASSVRGSLRSASAICLKASCRVTLDLWLRSQYTLCKMDARCKIWGQFDLLMSRHHAGCWSSRCLAGGHADVPAVQCSAGSRPA